MAKQAMTLNFCSVLVHNFSTHILLAKVNLMVLPWEKIMWNYSITTSILMFNSVIVSLTDMLPSASPQD